MNRLSRKHSAKDNTNVTPRTRRGFFVRTNKQEGVVSILCRCINNAKTCLVSIEGKVFLLSSSSSIGFFTAGNLLVRSLSRACDQAYSFRKDIDFFNCYANMCVVVYVGFFILFVYPFMSVALITVLFLSAFFFHEPIMPGKELVWI